MNPTLWDFSNYMTIESLGVASVAFMMKVEYTKDGRAWKTLEAYENLRMKGECVSFKSVLEPGERVGTINIIGRCNLRGNCLSLIFGDEASGKNDIHLYPNCLSSTFSSTEIINIDKGFLPATTLASNCYYNMFNGCKSLVNAPELPATTLAGSCYSSMFYGCTSLVNAPELPATTLKDSCYYYMFNGCTSLVNAPELPAIILMDYCYVQMFNGCNKINYIKMLATDISADYCLYNWVKGVASSGTFVKNKYATWDVTGDSGVPDGWTIQKV